MPHGEARRSADVDFVVVPATSEMHADSSLLSTNVAVAWFKDGRKDVPLPRGATAALPCSFTAPYRGEHCKTIAGIDVVRPGAGLSLQQTSARLTFSHKSRVVPASAANAAEFLVCRSLGIVKDGEEATTKALDAFAKRFKDHLPNEVLSAMRKLFKVDNAHTTTVEDAFI
ncbi:hypothetical protein ZWY2020_011079 [Hordeum vulgare]|nr:hypothetical protein ZWY2020_011079 [Hordeum vulgare]